METRTMSEIVENTILNVVVTNKAVRKANIQAVLEGLPKIRQGVKLENTNLIIDLNYGIQAETDFQNRLQEVINGHDTTFEKGANGHRLLIVNLLKPRV